MRKIFWTVFFIILLCALLLLPACGEDVGSLSLRFEKGILAWDAYSGASYYQVQCKMADGTGYFVPVTDTSYTPPSTLSSDYRYKVSAYNKNGELIARSKEIFYHLGAGTKADPIEISNANELLSITGKKSVTLGNKTVSVPLYYRLTADIDLTGQTVSPIGNSIKPFGGVFDGNGHTILGFTLTDCNSDAACGLFGAIQNAVIKNLTLRDASILFDKNSGVKKSANYFGLLVGSSKASTIDNCHVIDGSVEILKEVITVDKTYTLSVGGIVGSATSGCITGCSFSGVIDAQYGVLNAGGIVGSATKSSLLDYTDFYLLNCKADAIVQATATAYNVQTGESYAKAHAGVIAGDLSYTTRIASVLALGNATAAAKRDLITPSENLVSGVFGRTNDNRGTMMTPMYKVFYSNTISHLSGTATDLGSYKNYVYCLTEEALKEKDSYFVGSAYALDFDRYWTISEGESPELAGISTTPEPPALTFTVKDSAQNLSSTFSLSESFASILFEIGLAELEEGALFDLSTVLSALGIEPEKGDRIVFSAPGCKDVTITLKSNSLNCYLEYASYPSFEMTPTLFGGYKLVDAAALEVYDFTKANHITITILPQENAES